ncbi:glycoside hydrolase family 2 protein [Cohnella sp. GCM10012308]|uniref:beta-mannosidase n=1 Tax=Cohnella sp. GCM10012308 TaxID=3317329 RepID=UPI00361F0B46
MKRQSLNEAWRVKACELHVGADELERVLLDNDGWLAADLPCDVRMPLIREGIIEEPLTANHCFDSEWVERRSWWFRKSFRVDEADLADACVAELALESLDCEADLFLNGRRLGHHRSAFYPFSRDVKAWLRAGDNELVVRLTTGSELHSEADVAKLKNTIGMEGFNGRGEAGRIMLRKPQYVFGWDWGPRLASCGIMGNAALRFHRLAAIRSVAVDTRVEGNDGCVAVTVEADQFHSYATREARFEIGLYDGEALIETMIAEVPLASGLNYIRLDGRIPGVKLWWPSGMGEQRLYAVRVAMIVEDERAEHPPVAFGVRTIRLNQERIGCGAERRFAIEINGVALYGKGANWIPPDSIYARVGRAAYEKLLGEAAQANFNLIRVWGGGRYEPDCFYELCDRLGLLVWQDFMFACAGYPDRLAWFRGEVEREMDYQTRRLRNHASLALWCGSNENHWAFDEWWTGEKQAEYFGGAFCYNYIAPAVVRRNCPHIPYWNSSPYGGAHPNGSEAGDRHHWFECTMNEQMEKRIAPEEYDKLSGKFISEYGYIGPPGLASIRQYFGSHAPDRSCAIWDNHTNVHEKKTVPAGIIKHYADPEKLDLDGYLHYAGLTQGLMLQYSLEAIRRKEDCSGSLFWMYNDCWGEVGWSIVDYYHRRKIAYYFVKRAFAPVRFILREAGGEVEVTGCNDTAAEVELRVEYGYRSFDGTVKNAETTAVVLKPFSRCKALRFPKGAFDNLAGVRYVLPLSTEIAEPAWLRTNTYREMRLPMPRLRLAPVSTENGQWTVEVSTDVFAHAVHFDFGPGNDAVPSDNYFDLLPGQRRIVKIAGLDPLLHAQVSVRSGLER